MGSKNNLECLVASIFREKEALVAVVARRLRPALWTTIALSPKRKLRLGVLGGSRNMAVIASRILPGLAEGAKSSSHISPVRIPCSKPCSQPYPKHFLRLAPFPVAKTWKAPAFLHLHCGLLDRLVACAQSIFRGNCHFAVLRSTLSRLGPRRCFWLQTMWTGRLEQGVRSSSGCRLL